MGAGGELLERLDGTRTLCWVSVALFLIESNLIELNSCRSPYVSPGCLECGGDRDLPDTILGT